MGHLQKVIVFASFGLAGSVATLAMPAVAQAQPGERPATQLFIGPTGRVLPKGEGYMKAVAFSVPFFQGGLTDRLSLGIGAPIFALGEGVMITPKFQVHKSATSATSVGAVQALTTAGGGGFAYVAHTQGSEASAIHVAVVSAYGNDSGLHGVGVMIGAEHRLNTRVTFITENYLVGGSPMISAGVRVRAPHTTWDLGWLTLPSAGVYGPIINVGYKF